MNDFSDRIRRIAHLLLHEQDTSSFDPLEVEAAKIYLKDQGPEEPETERPPSKPVSRE